MLIHCISGVFAMFLRTVLNKSEYYPGKTLDGKVVLTTETAIKAWKIRAWCIGMQHAKITSIVKGKKSTQHIDVPFHGPWRMNKSMLVWKSDGVEDIGPGQLSFPFSFLLPKSMPPSFSLKDPVTQYPFDADRKILTVKNEISYRIETWFDAKTIPGSRMTTPFTVKYPIAPSPVSLTIMDDRSNMDGVSIELHLLNNLLKHGEVVKGITTVITNPTVLVENIETRLVCISSFQFREFHYMVQKEIFTLSKDDAEKSFEFKFMVPSGLPCSLDAEKQTSTKVTWYIVSMFSYHLNSVDGETSASRLIMAKVPILVIHQDEASPPR